MWGEGASDLWGRLEEEAGERDLELLDAVRSRLRAEVAQAEEERTTVRPNLDPALRIW